MNLNNTPIISIVVITYNHEDFISETLDGIIMQQFNGKIEVILSNDNSPDNTHYIIEEYLNSKEIPSNFKIDYTKHKKNLGMMGNFNWTLEQAKGKYIALCEGDDYWTDPLKLQKQVDFMEANSNCTLLTTNAQYYYEELKKFKEFSIPKKYINPRTRVINPKYIFSKKGVVLPTASFMFRNSLVKDITFQKLLQNISVGDRCVILASLYNGDVCNLKSITTVYRVSFTGGSHTARNISKIEKDDIAKGLALKNKIFDQVLKGKFNAYKKYEASAMIAAKIAFIGKKFGNKAQFELLSKYKNQILLKDYFYLIPRIIKNIILP